MSDKPYSLTVRAVILDDQAMPAAAAIQRLQALRRQMGMAWRQGDDGEAFDAALRREVREETGLEVEPVGVVGAIGFEMEKARVALLCMEAGRPAESWF